MSILLGVGIFAVILILIFRYTCDTVLEELSYSMEEQGRISEVENNDEENRLSQVVIDLQPPKYIKKRAEQKCCQRLNRQEALFPCGRCGISMMLFELQLILNFSLLALMALGWYEMIEIKEKLHWGWYFFASFVILVYLYCAFYILPVCIRKFMLATNVSFLIRIDMKKYRLN